MASFPQELRVTRLEGRKGKCYTPEVRIGSVCRNFFENQFTRSATLTSARCRARHDAIGGRSALAAHLDTPNRGAPIPPGERAATIQQRYRLPVQRREPDLPSLRVLQNAGDELLPELHCRALQHNGRGDRQCKLLQCDNDGSPSNYDRAHRPARMQLLQRLILCPHNQDGRSRQHNVPYRQQHLRGAGDVPGNRGRKP